jgi:2-iminobutanoate/2-iminopropanoate deaminase
MSRYGIDAKKLPKAGPYSHAVATKGLVYFSGQVGTDPKTGKLVGPDITAQTKQTFKNIAMALKEAECDFDDVIKVNVYMSDLNDFAAMNAVMADVFTEPYPARTTIGVAALPLGARVEIEVVCENGPLTP